MSDQANADIVDMTTDEGAGLADAGVLDDVIAVETDGPSGESFDDPNQVLNPTHDDANSGDDLGRQLDGELGDVDTTVDDIESYLAQVERLTESEPSDSINTDSAADTPKPPDDQADEEPATTPDSGETRAPQFRLRPRSPLGERAFALMKEDPYLSEVDAFMQAQRGLSGSDAASDDSLSDGDTPEAETETATVADVEARIRDLRRQSLAAKREYDLDKEAEIEEQLLDLEESLPALRAAEQQRSDQAEREEAQWVSTAQAALDLVRQQYPESADKDGAFYQRMIQIDDAWRDAGDCRWADASKASLLADIVAREFGRVPVTSGGRKTPVSRSAHIAQHPPTDRSKTLPSLAPAVGGSRTTHPASFGDRVLQVANNITSPDQFWALLDKLGAS